MVVVRGEAATLAACGDVDCFLLCCRHVHHHPPLRLCSSCRSLQLSGLDSVRDTSA
jgi:hypothetical protein